MTNPIKFNPFNQILAADERLRLKSGVLTVEKSDIRSSSSAWTRFWTRGQYSQTAILKKMCKIYKKTQDEIGKDEKRDTFKKNFETLEGRATLQNEEYKDRNPIVRFFEAKSFIDVTTFHNKFQKVDTDIVSAADKKVQLERVAIQNNLELNKRNALLNENNLELNKLTPLLNENTALISQIRQTLNNLNQILPTVEESEAELQALKEAEKIRLNEQIEGLEAEIKQLKDNGGPLAQDIQTFIEEDNLTVEDAQELGKIEYDQSVSSKEEEVNRLKRRLVLCKN